MKEKEKRIEGKGKERKGKNGKGRERKGQKGKKGKKRKGKKRKGREKKGKERKVYKITSLNKQRAQGRQTQYSSFILVDKLKMNDC